MITVKSFQYIPSTPGYIKQGIKGNRVPKGAVGGSNGSFAIAGDPPQILINLSSDDGNAFAVDYYPFVKANSNRRVTEKYATQICTPVVGKSFKDDRTLAMALAENFK